MLDYHKITPSIKIADAHLNTWAEKLCESKVSPKNTTQCPQPELEPMQTAQSGVKCTNHEATTPSPVVLFKTYMYSTRRWHGLLRLALASHICKWSPDSILAWSNVVAFSSGSRICLRAFPWSTCSTVLFSSCSPIKQSLSERQSASKQTKNVSFCLHVFNNHWYLGRKLFELIQKTCTTKHTFGSALAGKSGSKREGTSSDANTSAGGRHSSVETVPTFCPLTRTTSSANSTKKGVKVACLSATTATY